MARSDAQRRADAKYQRKAHDSKLIKMRRGMMEQLQALADAEGVSLNRYILEAVEARSGLKLTLDGEFKTKKSD